MSKREYPDTSPILAFVMSLFIPSSGQFYNKQPIKGFCAILIFVAGIFSLTYVGWLLWLVWLGIAMDAVLTSMHYRKQRRKEMDFYI